MSPEISMMWYERLLLCSGLLLLAVVIVVITRWILLCLDRRRMPGLEARAASEAASAQCAAEKPVLVHRRREHADD